MSKTLSVSVKTPNGKEVWVACGNCGKVTRHDALVHVATSDHSPEHEIEVWDDYMVVQCGGCRTVSFCAESRCSEDYTYDPNSDHERLVVTTRVYPQRIAGRTQLEHAHLLPHLIYKIYQETCAAIGNDQPVLAGIGIRAIVETVCKERSATGNDLMSKINNLAARGVFTAEGAEILHSLRFMGNNAAHEVMAHTGDDLMTALDVAEYVLKGVYILPKLAANLPKGEENMKRRCSCYVSFPILTAMQPQNIRQFLSKTINFRSQNEISISFPNHFAGMQTRFFGINP
jgi:hypothetical protein